MNALDKVEDNFMVLVVALTVLLLPLAWLSSAFDVFGAVKFFLLVFLALLSLAIQTWQTIKTGKLRLPGGWAGLALAAFLVWLILSTIFSPVPLISLFGLRKRLLGVATYAAAGILLTGAARISWDKTKLRYVYYSTSIAVTLTSLVGLAQRFGSTFPFDLKNLFTAAYSTFGNPNYFGLFLAMTLPIPLHLIFEGRSFSDRLIGAMALVSGIAGLAAAESSGAVVGAVASSGAYLVARYLSDNKGGARTAKIAIALLLSVVCLGSVYAVTQEKTAIGQRLWIWSAGSRVAAAHPLMGVGLENLRSGLEELAPLPERNASGQQYEDAHNTWINLAATAGLPAPILAAAFFALVWIAAMRGPIDNDFKRRAAPVFAAAGIGYLTAAQFNPEDIGSLPLLWMFSGIAIGLSGKAPAFYVQLKPQAKPVAVLVIGALIFASAGFAYKSLSAEIDLVNANTAQTLADARAAFRAAQDAQPWQTDYYTLEIYRLIPNVESLSTPVGRELVSAARQAVKRNQKNTSAWLAYADLYRAAALRQNDSAPHKIALDISLRVLAIDKYNARAMRQAALTYNDLNEPRLSLQWIRRYERFFTDDADLVNLKYDLLNDAGATKPDKG